MSNAVTAICSIASETEVSKLPKGQNSSLAVAHWQLIFIRQKYPIPYNPSLVSLLQVQDERSHNVLHIHDFPPFHRHSRWRQCYGDRAGGHQQSQNALFFPFHPTALRRWSDARDDAMGKVVWWKNITPSTRILIGWKTAKGRWPTVKVGRIQCPT